MKSNSEIYNVASSFLNIAELAKDKAIEIDVFLAAFNANLAFSIELYIKSLDAKSFEKLDLEVGSAKFYSSYAQSNIKGHLLNKCFNTLPGKIQNELSKRFKNHQYNVTCSPLIKVLENVNDHFVTARYAFERDNHLSDNDSDVLLFLARFFRDELRP
ncbi:hypothetical protein CXF86_19330 [Shewanella sp. GutCb]|uniref:hypothetical protein n=1 Tax=Shewanella sp. GutCb TaxID=2058315 RepID=UPI000C7BEA6B|nr:hypothetical protein [Shewanella sp. GutCb]PKG73115.1 hypothetical protein CXF86_19330 [Shewanella sp. GutCb]